MLDEEIKIEDKIEELLRMTADKRYRELKLQLVEMNEVDIASFIEELDSEKTVVVFRMMPKELATEVFACLPVEKQQHIITSITDYELRSIIDDLYVDDAVDMLEELPASIVKRVLQNSSPDTRKLINQFLNYPENSAGSVMTAEYVGLKKQMTVEEAFAYIRKYGVDKETIYTCYVMDEKRRLEGVVTVKDLLMNPYDTVLGDIMDVHVIKAYTTEDREEVVDTFNEYSLLSLPVVDKENRLVGIITVDDVMDVMEQEATEDFEKMAAMLPSVPQPETARHVLRKIKRALNLQILTYAGNEDLVVKEVALCGGAGASFIADAAAAGAQLYLTGDVKYHEAQDAVKRGMVIADGGHYGTEIISIPVLAQRLQAAAKERDWQVCFQADPTSKDMFGHC